MTEHFTIDTDQPITLAGNRSEAAPTSTISNTGLTTAGMYREALQTIHNSVLLNLEVYLTAATIDQIDKAVEARQDVLMAHPATREPCVLQGLTKEANSNHFIAELVDAGYKIDFVSVPVSSLSTVDLLGIMDAVEAVI